MITTGNILAFFNSSNQTNAIRGPQICPRGLRNYLHPRPWYLGCFFDPFILSTLSYQAVMQAFTDLLTGTVSLEFRGNAQMYTNSTTRLTSTVLADAPDLAFLQTAGPQKLPTSQYLQQEATTWKQQPFAGLVSAKAATSSTLPFRQALEQLFQNITISLMSAPDLQYVQMLLLLSQPRGNAQLTW